MGQQAFKPYVVVTSIHINLYSCIAAPNLQWTTTLHVPILQRMLQFSKSVYLAYHLLRWLLCTKKVTAVCSAWLCNHLRVQPREIPQMESPCGLIRFYPTIISSCCRYPIGVNMMSVTRQPCDGSVIDSLCRIATQETYLTEMLTPMMAGHQQDQVGFICCYGKSLQPMQIQFIITNAKIMLCQKNCHI